MGFGEVSEVANRQTGEGRVKGKLGEIWFSFLQLLGIYYVPSTVG